MANLTLPPTRDAYTGRDGKPTAAFFDSLSKSQRAVNTLSRIPIIPSIDDVDSIPSGAEGALIFSDQGVPAPYVSRLNEPSHSGKVYRDGQWFELIRNDGCYITDFGGKNNLAFEGPPYFNHGYDNTPALNAANEYSVIKQKSKILIPSGVWECKSQPDSFPVGLNLVGDGFSSSQLAGGSSNLMRSYNAADVDEPFLHWDGTGLAANTTGGGARDLTIITGVNTTLGTAIKVDAPLQPDAPFNRPGYMTFMNLQIAGNSGGYWGYCVYVDGHNCYVDSGQGLRDTVWINIWYNSWHSSALAGFYLNNATHAKLLGVTASPGSSAVSGADPIAMLITGDVTFDAVNYPQRLFDTNDVTAAGLETYGKLILDRARNCNISGKFQTLKVTGNCTGTIITPATSPSLIDLTGTSRAALFAQGTVIHDGLVGTQFGNSTNGGEFMPGGRIKKWMNVTGVDTSWATYSWSTFLGGNDVPFTAAPTLVSLSTGSGALTTPGYDNIAAGTIDLRAQAASQVVRVVAEGPY